VALRSTHPREDLLRYLDGEVSEEEKRELEKHLSECETCRNYVSLVGRFNERLGQLSEDEFTAQEPCPDSWTLVSYEAGKVDEETARHLRAHLLFCDSCQEEFYALRRSSHEESWRELIKRLEEFVIDLAKSYGPGTLIGSIRIVAEQPLFAVRGTEPAKAVSKVLEVTVGENSYSLEVVATGEGSIACDIAGARTPVKEPLTASVQWGPEAELLSVQTDRYGNTHFAIPAAEDPETVLLLKLKLKDSEEQFLIRVPRAPEPV
jgi:anti-sigma-K factor RskA